jgi:hypothetical protein
MSSVPVVADRVMRARRESVCILCRGVIRTGNQIAKCPGRQWVHVACFIGHRHNLDVPASQDGAAPKGTT